MKNQRPITGVILLFLFCIAFVPVHAADYYFSSTTGNDGRTAREAGNAATPWKSLEKLNAIFGGLRPGDRIFFKRGDVFDGAINVTASGSNGNPIELGAYGSGDAPVISGLSSLSVFIKTGGNVWETSVANGGEAVNVLLLNGTPQRIGRYPNSDAANGGYLTLESHNTNTSITDNELSSSPAWNGGEVVIRKNRWVLDRNRITAHNGNTISYASESGYHASDKFGYFIQNHPAALDKNGEWYYNASGKKIGIYATGSAPSSVEVSTVNTLVSISRQNNVWFSELSFKGANQNAFYLDNADNIKLSGCTISYSGANAVLALSCDRFTAEGCSIFYSNNTALELRSATAAVIRNNTIKSTGVFEGMGKGDSGAYEGILIDGDNETIEGNTIENTGYIPVTFRGNNNNIKNNYITTYNTVKDDGGGIYSWNNSSGASPTYGSKITGNIVLNGIGAPAGTDNTGYAAANGIYMDDNTSGIEISGNSIANCGLYGLYVHNGHELTITGNTFFNSKTQAVFTHDGYAPQSPIRNLALTGNIFFAKDNRQRVAEFNTPNNDIAAFGNFNNNYYCRPTFPHYFISTSNNPNSLLLDLDEWKTFSGKDASSLPFPAGAASDQATRFEYNAGNTTKTISLDGTYIDAKGVTHNGNISLPPYSSAVLVKQDGIANACPGAGSIMREQWNNVVGGSLSSVQWLSTPSKTMNLHGALETYDVGDNYGSRIKGYICPPQTGNYTFWIAGDDYAELWLSTDASPSRKVKIAALSVWTEFREWNKAPSQKSATVQLEAGTKYYIEIVHKEGAGGDHVSVAWQLPDGVFEGPIPGTRLSPTDAASSLTNQTIFFPAIPATVIGSGVVHLSATASSGLPVNFAVVSGPATINGNELTPTAAGTVVISATQAGNSQYNPAPEVRQTLTVTALPAATCSATGTILREQWNGINGNDVVQIPLATLPSSTQPLTEFEGPVDVANQYGSRIRGYICAPQNGQYFFWIAGDDATELWLSSGDDPAAKTKIAYSLSWTAWRQWDKFSSQRSAAIYLEAGKKYYIEALQKEGGGGDHLSVAWQLPDGTRETPIRGNHLSPYTTATVLQNQSISFPALADVTLGAGTITLAATASSSLPVSYGIVSGNATISGNIVTPTTAGTVVIKASQAGNAQYNPAPDVQQSFAVLSPADAQCSATGSILHEQWNGIGGNDIIQIPANTQPSAFAQLSSFETLQNSADRYGARIRGYICPPQTGAYVFFIAGDDATELWLSSTDNPAAKIKIAYSLWWTGWREWTKYATQKSAAVYLEAGKRYYIEALQKEGGGEDHLAVAWQLPDGTTEAPIAGSHLSPYENTLLQKQVRGNVIVAGEVDADKTSSILSVYPNPFSQQATVRVTPAHTERITLDVIDPAGRVVENLYNGPTEKGKSQTFVLKSGKLAAGVYFLRLASGSGVYVSKMVKSE